MKKILNFCLVAGLVVIFVGCFATSIPTFQSRVIDDIPAKTISSVTIELEPISLKVIYDYPELFKVPQSFFEVEGWSLAKYILSRDYENNNWYYIFANEQSGLSPFKVKITNNTEHIIKMSDARIYLLEGDRDPYEAIGKIDELRDWVSYVESKNINFPESYAGMASSLIKAHSRDYKLINDIDREILPGFSYGGLLVFPTIPKAEPKDVKVVFYNITTKTDAAGNPSEKAMFEFPLTNKITNFHFDPDTKRWKEGLPPESVTE